MTKRFIVAAVMAATLAGTVAPSAHAGPFLDRIKEAASKARDLARERGINSESIKEKLVAGASRTKCAAKALLGRPC